ERGAQAGRRAAARPALHQASAEPVAAAGRHRLVRLLAARGDDGFLRRRRGRWHPGHPRAAPGRVPLGALSAPAAPVAGWGGVHPCTVPSSVDQCNRNVTQPQPPSVDIRLRLWDAVTSIAQAPRARRSASGVRNLVARCVLYFWCEVLSYETFAARPSIALARSPGLPDHR